MTPLAPTRAERRPPSPAADRAEAPDVLEQLLLSADTKSPQDGDPSRAGLIGASAALRAVADRIERVAATPRTTVLIQGESGVGKELVARAIHALSARSSGPFVAVNCAALSEGLVESELFGYEPGSFTGGAAKGHTGLFAAARGGTLLLDEVGELAPAFQAKLLRVLQERTYRRVGSVRDVEFDARILASTHRDLASMVAAGSFREDLFYRLNVLSLNVPALRDRREDVAPLCAHFLEQLARELSKPSLALAEDALRLLEGHEWPGNVRELRNALERAALLCANGVIRAGDLELLRSRPAAARETTPPEDRSLRAAEESLIRRVLDECANNRSRAASVLGINRATLYNKLRVYGIGA